MWISAEDAFQSRPIDKAGIIKTIDFNQSNPEKIESTQERMKRTNVWLCVARRTCHKTNL